MRAMGERVGKLEREVDVLKVEKEVWKKRRIKKKTK